MKGLKKLIYGALFMGIAAVGMNVEAKAAMSCTLEGADIKVAITGSTLENGQWDVSFPGYTATKIDITGGAGEVTLEHADIQAYLATGSQTSTDTAYSGTATITVTDGTNSETQSCTGPEVYHVYGAISPSDAADGVVTGDEWGWPGVTKSVMLTAPESKPGFSFDKWDDADATTSRLLSVSYDFAAGKVFTAGYKTVAVEKVEIQDCPSEIYSDGVIAARVIITPNNTNYENYTEWTIEGHDCTPSRTSYTGSNLPDTTVTLASGKTEATVDIVAKAGGKSSEKKTVKVKKLGYTPEISGSATATKGSTVTYTASGNPSELTGSITFKNWASNPATGVTFSTTSGKTTDVTFAENGSFTLSVDAYKGSDKLGTATLKVTVSNGQKNVESVTVTPDSATIEKGKTAKFNATIAPEGATAELTWSSSDESIAKVDATGTVTAVAKGTATIMASAGGKSGTANVTVTDPSSDKLTITIKITDGKKSFEVDDEIVLKATVKNSAGDTVKEDLYWSTSKDDVVELDTDETAYDEEVTVLGVGKGKVTITAEDEAGNKGTIALTVTGASGIAIDDFSIDDIRVTVGFSVPVKGAITPKNATNKSPIDWSIDDESIATVSGDKLSETTVKGVKTGSTTLNGLIEDGLLDDDAETDADVYVYSTPTLEYDTSAGTLKVTLPSAVYTGADAEKNLTSVSGAYLVATYGGSEIWNSGSNLSSSGTGFIISASSLQSIVDAVKTKLSGSSAVLNFAVYPVGTNVNGSTGAKNTDVSSKVDVTVYQVSVIGENVTPTSYYGVLNGSVKITATPTTGYSFSKWSDGSSTNPRTVTVSADTSKNTYSATAVLGTRVAGADGKYTKGSNGLDAVPKTGEGADVFVLWAVLIVTLGGGFAIYRIIRPQLYKANEESKDRK